MADLAEKMVFIGGPRQIGKTTFARDIIGKNFKSSYYNWDFREDRRRIISSSWDGFADLLILDEIHKYGRWKNLLKGEYDKLKDRFKFLVTGSARLDIYRRGGDSLQGRYHYYRMHPFTLAEIMNKRNAIDVFAEFNIVDRDYSEDLETLFKFGGFPEPLIKANERFSRRWHNEKIERLFLEEIRSIEQIRDMESMKLLSDLLPQKVGSLLSINNLREDLEVSFRAVASWITVLEKFYYVYRIYPYSSKVIHSIRKAAKLFLWDWSEIENPGMRFENMIASHLLKLAHYLHDHDGYRAEVHFLRNIDQKEVDFLFTIDNKPWFAVETKLRDVNTSKPLLYFAKRMDIPYLYQIVKTPNVDILKDNVRILSADRFLAALI